MAESTVEMTPLKQKLDEFGNLLSKVTFIMFIHWTISLTGNITPSFC